MSNDRQHAWPDDLHPLVTNQEIHYRLLERNYRQSAQYAAMVERYPLLKQSIETCQQGDLIGDASPSSQLTAVHLEWDRSHGEG
ncbi:MAG: hypothetical protein QM522_01010 [Chitinophagaceae bacterium]|jgi:hypothetical protein|nr:hypothetical protein [Chitinophagaceae bacterium]